MTCIDVSLFISQCCCCTFFLDTMKVQRHRRYPLFSFYYNYTALTPYNLNLLGVDMTTFNILIYSTFHFLWTINREADKQQKKNNLPLLHQVQWKKSFNQKWSVKNMSSWVIVQKRKNIFLPKEGNFSNTLFICLTQQKWVNNCGHLRHQLDKKEGLIHQ